ncbi:O-methyltransferase [Psilocybe cubensis]|uniref:O-methyltransferase n=1 Tax=Psilocybe cubensis TaxID=181762 RepID=A0ACB8HCU9_PSICU|nr:O-methyltransferase [Psilocybe cubensis]KAH9485649.1 O-methyltransferase [Psilocybe cubensis]
MAQPMMLALAKLISDSVAKVDQLCIEQGVIFPSLDDPFTTESESIKLHPEVAEAANYIISAAAQLIAILRPVPVTLSTSAIHVHVSSALRVVVDSNVVEILREAGPQGLHVKKISEKNGVEAGKLEITPDVFATNRISSALDTGKPYEELVKKTDESVKSSGFLYEALTYSSSEKAPSPPSPFNLAFNTELHIFSWLAQKGNEYRLQRFGIAFDGFDKMLPVNGVTKGYRWGSLPKGSIVVDVGGGVGSESMKIAKTFPDLKVIIQDAEGVVANGVKTNALQFYETRFPEGLSSAHDFFTPNPVTNARVFFMRFILHDWPDATCVKILKNLREVAAPDTELIINECLIQYACSTESDISKSIPGGRFKPPPSPLLPNLGYARIFHYLIDLQMAIVAHGVERTVEQYASILQKSGWKLKEVLRMPESAYSLHKLVAVPQPE